MTSIADAVAVVVKAQKSSKKPLAVVLAGHNGSGKSTMWRRHLSEALRFPLVNADRMMMSVLPEPDQGKLPTWARDVRDTDENWMLVARNGVESFVAQAMALKVSFAWETVFSHWKVLDNGSIESKIDRINQLQEAGYFVLVVFVGLSDYQLSIARVSTRIAEGGHAVEESRLRDRFPRTQHAIRAAADVTDAIIFTDNSRDVNKAFTVCRIQLGKQVVFDIRTNKARRTPDEVLMWLDIVSPI